MVTDEEIVGQILNGETHLYERLMRKYNLRLFRISMSIIDDDMAVEDVMQTAYINAWLNLAGFKNKSSFSAVTLTAVISVRTYNRAKAGTNV